MRISKLACLSPPPFAPDVIEPGVFVLRQVFDRERILGYAANVLFVFMCVIILLGLITQLLGSIWPRTTIPMLNLMLVIMPYPLLVVGWLLWTLTSFVRYFTERSRTREVRIEKLADGSHDITINDHLLKGRLFASDVRIWRRRGIFARSKQFLAICVDAGNRVQIVVCTDEVDELEEWQARLEVDWVPRETALSVRGVL